MVPENAVWVFNGERGGFAGAVFSTRDKAEAWIREHRLSGVLTAYPLDEGCFDWAMRRGLVSGRARDRGGEPDFIASFTSAGMEHFHYEHGE